LRAIRIDVDALRRQPVLAAWLGVPGRHALGVVGGLGSAFVFFARTARGLVQRPLRGGEVLRHLQFIGNRSLVIIGLTSMFTGMVLVLQAYDALQRFGSEKYIGPVVALSLVRELGPVLAAIMVTARAGSATAATLGNMRITEQIDALEAMAVDSVQFLASTRLLAAIVAMPLLTAMFDVAAIGAAHAFGTAVLGLDGDTMMAGVRDAVTTHDVSTGVVKSLVFGVGMAVVSCYRGYYASGGTRGVGIATSRAVVEVCTLVLLTDYAMTALLFS
jgi:phospholipid/cholesterol/gamma-HCH transport system permease protein